MVPRTRNLRVTINQGTDFNAVILIKNSNGPADITGFDFSGEIKLDTNPETEIAATFDFAILNQSTNRGQVAWTLPKSITAALLASTSDAERNERLTTPYVFDVKMTDASDLTSRIIEGIVLLSPEVTV